ncbi:unnamed protein product [Euphydryas editha]|uniref:Seipin n=1 Tax=Euphydryas editha TaxID=104508 RepID=A0AAU9UL88_EUPED|nr:unnamed protein product [Euphydryas editha]
MALLPYINPFKAFHDLIRYPIVSFVNEQYTGYKKKTNDSITSIKEIIYRVAVVSVFLSAIMWISIFLYVVFYYTYMPNVTHMRPVHLQFKSCDEILGVCSFPSAHVQLTRRSHMLMSSQSYRIKLLLEVPESQINKDLGMFMVCAQMRAAGGVLVSSSCRSTMLRYRSKIHQIIRTLVYAPLLIAGIDEEKQIIQVELFSDFQDDPNHPVTDAYVELQSRFVQVFSSELQIEAHFTGLRYVMYYWPKISALIGISSNFFFVSLMFILSWYHLQDGFPDFVKTKLGIEVKKEKEDDDKKLFGKIKLEREDSFPFIEEETLLEEFQKLEEQKEKKKS